MNHDGPQSPLFHPLPIGGSVPIEALPQADVSQDMRDWAHYAPNGSCTGWGIPFEIDKMIFLRTEAVSVALDKVRAQWLVFMHTADIEPILHNADGFVSPAKGRGLLGEHIADYVVCYADGSEERTRILRQHQVGMFKRRAFGENCVEAVQHFKPYSYQPVNERTAASPLRGQFGDYFAGHARAVGLYSDNWLNWLWAWENPHPRKAIVGLRFEPVAGTILLAAVSAGTATAHPLRWDLRRKAVLALPKGTAFASDMDARGRLQQIQLDMGQVISAQPRTLYPNAEWPKTYNNREPKISAHEILVEYAAHPDARFHLADGKTVPVAKVTGGQASGTLTPVASAHQRVLVRVLEKGSRKPVAVKLHVHGESGEYLTPTDRLRIASPGTMEDIGAEFLNKGTHRCTYISGETTVDLPLGNVYIEVSKGFEIKPIRKVVAVGKATRTITLTVEKALNWRERGWVTADTHVHFLSPQTALLEGAGEGVNVVNLLAAQWGELMTNAGDFDGKTTFGSKEAGGDGEWLVRVGTENRQNVMGHMSLLGYSGAIIAPMSEGGAEEGFIGQPVGALLSDWARQCRKQGGLSVLAHFPDPRMENAAAIVHGEIDAVEMKGGHTDIDLGMDPYCLSDWYRYLNCGYFVPAVAGTDKMSALMCVGALRTYARIPDGRLFDHDAWMDAVRAGNTFVTNGPLLEFAVEGKPAGSRIEMSATGGTVDIAWNVASVTLPMSRIDLIVNGEIRESKKLAKWNDAGQWRLRVDRSSWMALLIRGHHPDKREIIAAHSSPVIVNVAGSPFFAGADALTILDQIEGALVFLDTVGSRDETNAYKRMRMTLVSAHRKLHNQMHRAGLYHPHTPATDHKEHH